MSFEERIRSALAGRAADARARDDGWSDVERRLDEPPPLSELSDLPPIGRRLGVIVLAFAVFAVAGTFVWNAFRSGPPLRSQSAWDPTAYERTRELDGMELLQALGAVRVEFVPGQDVGTWQEGDYFEVNGSKVPGCPASGAPEYVLIGMGDGTFYCVGVRDGDEAFDIGRRAGATASNGYPSPPSSGYWIVFPDAPEPVSDGSDGAVKIVALTNLPDGTLFGVNTERGGMCCLPVTHGQMVIEESSSACDLMAGDHNPGTSVTIWTFADIGQHVLGVPIGSQPPQQPDSVLAILGAHFENLTGDQVVDRGGERGLVASASYAWPEPLCLK